MKKRICSFIMVLAMILAMLPAKVQAETNTPMLAYRNADFNLETGTYYENTGYGLQTEYASTPSEYGSAVVLYYIDADGKEQKLTASDVIPSSSSIVQVEADATNPEITLIKLVGFGDATINYSYNDTTYSILVSGVLPEVGYYTATTASVDTYLSAFTVTDTENTFYLLPKEGTLDSVTLDQDFAQIATAEISEDKTYAMITVTGEPNGNKYSVNAQMTRPDGSTASWMPMIKLLNHKSSLQFCLGNLIDGVMTPNGYLQNALNGTIGYTGNIYVYFVSGGQQQLMYGGNLTSSNPSIVKVSASADYADVAQVEFLDFGTATLTYTVEDKTYSFDAVVDLPSVGYYSTPNATTDSYITEFAVTDEGANVFYIAGYNCTLDNVVLNPVYGDFADIVLSDDKTYATITINGDFESKWCTFQGQMNRPDGTFDFGTGIYLKNERSALKYCYGSMSSGTMSPNGSLSGQLNTTKGSSSIVFPYFVKGGEQQLLKATDLQSSNENVVQISSHPTYQDVVMINAVDFGNASISYVKDEKSYSLDVNVGLPNVGFYTTTTASQSSYITEFTVTDKGPNVFYMVAREGALDNITMLSGLDNIATVTISEDKTYAAITVTGTPNNSSYTVQGQLTWDYGGTSSTRASIRLHNGKSTMKFDSVKVNSDGSVSPYGSPYDGMGLTKGYMNTTFVVFGTNGEYVTLTADQLKSSDESIVKISNSTNHSNTVVIEAVGFGTATISYVDDYGNTHSCEVQVNLPVVGYYTTPSANTSSYITKFTVTDDGPNVLYLVARGRTIDNLVLTGGLADIATVALSDDKSYATITVHGIPDTHSYLINYTATDTYGNTFSSGASIQLVNGKTSLQYEYVMWDEEGVPSPSGYPQSRMNIANGSVNSVYAYFVKNGIKEPVVAGNLKSSNENIVKVFVDEENTDIVNVEICGFGSAAITYTHSDGNTYELPITAILPAVGFYTTTTASESTYITEFAVTDDGPNVIYLATNSCELNSVTLEDDFSEIAKVTLSDDKTYATIEITGTPLDNEYGVRVGIKSGSNGWSADKIIRLKNEKIVPTPDVEVKVEENIPTVDASKPVEDVTVGVDKDASSTVLEDTVKEIISAIVNTPSEDMKDLEEKVSPEVVAAIQSALESGAELQVTTSVNVANLDEDTVVNEETKADIAAIKDAIENGSEENSTVNMEGAKVAQLLDIKVTVTAKVDNVEAATGNVSVLDEPVVFTVAIPEKLKEELKIVPEGYERQVYIIYVHDGAVKSIPAMQNEDGTISFAAQEFSTYALVYKDVPKAEPTPEPEQTPDSGEASTEVEDVVASTPTPVPVTPATGDTAQGAWYMVLSILCAVILGLLSMRRKMQK